MSSLKSITVAIFQGVPVGHGQVYENVKKMKDVMVQAKGRGADVVVFPELFTTGYTLSNDLMRQLAQDKSGSTFMQLSQQAKETGIAVVYGYPELVAKCRSKLHYYNSAQFIDKHGVSLANYRKTHLWVDDKQYEAVFTPGDSIDVIEFCGFKIGLLICFDVQFSEAVRVLALNGAKLILAPNAFGVEHEANFHNVVDFLLPAHCYENCLHIAFVNYGGSNFTGCSRIYDDKGQTIVRFETKEEGILTANIQENTATSHHLENRRPIHYKILSTGAK